MKCTGLAFVIALAAGCPHTGATGSSGLALSVAEGAAPLDVVVTAPANVVADGASTFNMMSGCGFEIDWGDALPRAPIDPHASCATFLRHTYGKAGSYRVHVSTYRILPTDSRETTWSDETTVVVR